MVFCIVSLVAAANDEDDDVEVDDDDNKYANEYDFTTTLDASFLLYSEINFCRIN